MRLALYALYPGTPKHLGLVQGFFLFEGSGLLRFMGWFVVGFKAFAVSKLRVLGSDSR